MPAKRPSPSLKKWLRNRWIRTLIATTAVLLLAAWYIVSADFCAERANAAVAKSQWTVADRWLWVGEVCRGSHRRLSLIRARLFVKRGRLDKFEESLRKAKANGATDAELHRERMLSAAAAGHIEPLGQALPQLLAVGEDLPEICEAFVLGCLSSYRLDQAAKILDLWQADFPGDPRPHLLRGRLFEHRSVFDRAIFEFGEAWKLSPNFAPAAYNLARILATENKYEESKHWYQLAAAKLVEPLPALIGQSRCLRELGRIDEARRLIAIAESRPIEGQQLEDAFRCVGEAAGTAKAQLAAEIGQVEFASENYRDACAAFAKALAGNPLDWRTRYSYSVALRQSGDREQAQIQAEQVEAAKRALDACDVSMDRLQKNPSDVEARFQVGAAILDHISENQGLIWLNSVLSINPHHGPTHRKLAEFYAANSSRSLDFARQAEWHRQQAQSDMGVEKTVEP